MKVKELIPLIKNDGWVISKDNGTFNSGCVIEEFDQGLTNDILNTEIKSIYSLKEYGEQRIWIGI